MHAGQQRQGIFTALNEWTTDISCEPVHPSSKTITDALAAAGGWGTGQTQFQMDMSLVVLTADAAAPMTPFQKAAGYFSPDCDDVTSVPMPVAGNIEGSAGYTCDVSNGDCHLLVVHQPTKKLYEVYQATTIGANLTGTCVAVWDLTKTYPSTMRGEQCTSADAAGFPMAAMLPDADEVAAGAVMHAIRFALPNPRIRAGVYVHPASHAGGPTGGPNMPPYGVRLRLRADYPIDSLPAGGARILAKALQRFGMFLSDGGTVPLMVQDDRYTKAKWATLNVDSHSLFGITAGDFQVVKMGTPVTLTYDCVRNP